jgi:hypothetical protein
VSLLRDATDPISGHREGCVRGSDAGANTDAETRQEYQHGDGRSQLSALDTLLKRGIISPEKHASEVAALKSRLE